jgi:hypothetical protein
MSTVNPCPCKPPVLYKQNMPFGGNYTDSSITNALRYSQLVRGKGPNFGRSSMAYNTINAFGYYAGGPGGSGAPPRNSF